MYSIVAFYDSLKHFEVPIEEYLKRLGKNLEIVQLKPSKKGSTEEIKRDETVILTEKLSKMKGYKILLDIGGVTFSTLEFSQFIQKRKQKDSKIIFIIGGVFGYTPELYKVVDYKMSLSLLTFPHNLALLNLLEQIYRIESIQSGKQYHY